MDWQGIMINQAHLDRAMYERRLLDVMRFSQLLAEEH
jgi:hypothetical protein